jgi:proteasome assembly chaperone (PAC2) family protein
MCLSTSNPEYKLLYSQGRELGRFLQRKLDFKLIASIYSSALPPEVKVANNGVASLVSNNFYLYSGSSRDYILLAGHSSPVDDQYEYAETVLDYADRLGVKEMVSFGARWTESVIPPLDAPKISGFASDVDGANQLESAGIVISRNESAFYFANFIVPLCKFHGVRGYKVSVDHGEPTPNPRSVMAFLAVLSRLFGLSVDDSDLHVQARQLEESIHKTAFEGSEENEAKSSQNDDIYR